MGRLVRIAVLITISLVAVISPSAGNAATMYTESFEADFGGWQPATDGQARDWLITRDKCKAVDGQYCLLYYLNGWNDDGTIWVERQFTVPPDAREVDMDFWLWNESDSNFGGWQVVAYIGLNRPSHELDFSVVGSTQDGLGWQQYHHAAPIEPGQDVWVAFGISAVWEVIRTHPVDLVSVSIH